MKRIFQKINRTVLIASLAAAIMSAGCSRDFLNPDGMSFYEPGATYSTESGLMASMAICDRHLKLYWVQDHNEMLNIGTEYLFSDLMVAAANDKTAMMSNIAASLTPTSESGGVNLDRTNSIGYFWGETYNGIKYANTILQYVDGITALDEATKNMYKGRAYFHRAFRYMALVFQYGDVPLVTKLPSVPKQNYRSTERDAILDMLRSDMEFAVQWVPNQSDMSMTGMINKGACRMLLTKIYLALGDYEKAKEQTDILIDGSGYSLMTEPFGTFVDGGEPETWPITRNVIWDLHRAENKLIAANKEVILGMPNRGATAEAMVPMLTMRILNPFVFNGAIQTEDGKQALENIKRNSSRYNPRYDYMRAIGRGIATWRPSPFQQYALWNLNGRKDATDLRHSSETGNWINMEDYRVNNENSSEFGNPLKLYSSDGRLLCNDTIRRWFAMPHYKFYFDDPINDANIGGSDGNRGATNGGNGDWYCYRLAEAYLLRAEAKFYINPADASIAEDLNIIRRRAKCTEMYSGAVTIGDIMNERARELYWEEWRNVELTRVSLCLARSGRPDEWGNTYDLATFDKQEGTDRAGGSYWYRRVINYNMYNSGITINVVASGQSAINYTMGKHNIYWPIPNSAITANSKGKLAQNYGYDGYDENTPKWETWQEAVADEDSVE
jgi:hypothetical protein